MKQYHYENKDGIVIKKQRDLKKELNYNHLNLTNKTMCPGELNFPEIYCDLKEIPDYIALYSQPSDYHRTEKTAVCFYDYDRKMDGQNGLYNAIAYNNQKDLKFFKERFRGVKTFFMPDYSVFGDIQAYKNYYRMGKAREVALWLTMENNSLVIPNLGVGCRKDLKHLFDGYEKVKVAGISTKSKLRNPEERALLQETINEAIVRIPELKVFIVYDTSADNRDVDILFKEAREQGIQVAVPDNSMKIRNRILKVRRAAK